MNYFSFNNFLPHDSRLILIDEVSEISETEAICKVKIPKLESIVGLTGTISPMISIEIIAQAAAIAKCARDQLNGSDNREKPLGGAVIRIKNFEFMIENLDIKNPLIAKVFWSNTNERIFNVTGQIFYANEILTPLIHGELLIAT